MSNIKKIGDLPKPKGGFKKIKDIPVPCLHPEHTPPMHMHLEPGVYEYSCPACGETKTITVPHITFCTEQYDDENPDYIRNTEDGI